MSKRAKKPGRLIVAANRLPVSRAAGGKWERSAGGLVSAMEPVLQARDSMWVGWTGGTEKSVRPFNNEGVHIVPVPLSREEIESFYHGQSNRTFWPLYHDAIKTPEFRRQWWKEYQEVNLRFAQRIARLARKGDTVWVHDYHLQLVPRMVREIKKDVKIGFFLHIPFPPPELFAWLPWRAAVLKGMLGADVVGFQTFENAQNFSRLARRYCGAEGTDTRLEYDKREVYVNSFPISIDVKDFEQRAEKASVLEEAQEIRERIGVNRKIILCVDRLDYTKGMEERLQAFEELLRRRTIKVADCVMVQVAVPSREHVPEYAETRKRVEETVGRINGDYSEPGRVAVHYFRRSISRDTLCAYYRAADVMLVSPLRDGMNLVAKEFVASRPDLGGVLVLSEFAGAARELRQAVLVNPRDTDGFAAAIAQALKMPEQEARRRMAYCRTQVRRHDVTAWSGEFLEAVK